MLEQLATIVRDKCLLQPPAVMLVGVSGGPDSLCLMHALHSSGLPIVVGHFNHQLRPEADAESAAVEAAAATIGARFVSDSADVKGHAEAQHISIEQSGRELRYRFLFAAAGRFGAAAVAVGHTADDQVETVLMHFIRGAGLDGLRGMSFRTMLPSFDANIPLVRPLLGVWRQEILAYCDSHGLAPHNDASNASPDFLRNRIRHDLLPVLETYNPRFREAVWRTSRTLAADGALLQDYLIGQWEQAVVRQSDDYIEFDATRLEAASPALRMHLIRLAARHLAPAEEATYAILERAAEFVADAAAARAELAAGLELFREAGLIYVSRGEQALPADAWPQLAGGADSMAVRPGASVELGAGWRFHAGQPEPNEASLEPSRRGEDAFSVWLDADRLPERMELRAARSGDRFEPLGMKGHTQKISDFFVNVKLPARARRRWPLLCSDDVVLWIPGYRPAETVSLRPDTGRSIRFTCSRLA